MIGSVPRTALVRRPTGDVTIPVAAVKLGDVVIVRDGEKIPVDGIVRAALRRLEISSAMGYNTWAAFQGTMARSAVCGDVAMMEIEVAPVIRALRSGDVEVRAVHNHMFFEEPRVIFLHYWGIGPADALAGTIRRALRELKPAEAGGASSASSTISSCCPH